LTNRFPVRKARSSFFDNSSRAQGLQRSVGPDSGPASAETQAPLLFPGLPVGIRRSGLGGARRNLYDDDHVTYDGLAEETGPVQTRARKAVQACRPDGPLSLSESDQPWTRTDGWGPAPRRRACPGQCSAARQTAAAERVCRGGSGPQPPPPPASSTLPATDRRTYCCSER
jgi:hypothetical protein